MYFLDFGDFQIAGACPEPLLTVAGAPRLDAADRRHAPARRDAGGGPRAIAAELLADEKERAEHVMLVDLGRNDLGRVCEYGTVAVDELMAVETYSHVMHIVSRSRARCATTSAPMDALRAALPAGTLSGAPKIRAMQIIDELEPVKRGGYGGAVGYLSLHRRPRHLHPHPHRRRQGRDRPRAGRRRHRRRRRARLTSTSESEAKARAVLQALGAGRAQADWP